MMDDQNAFVEEDCDEGDFDDEMDGMCTQGHHDGAFMFGSEAGLFTQAVESESDNENDDEDDIMIPPDKRANDTAKHDITSAVDDEKKEVVDSIHHCSDATLLCGESYGDMEDGNCSLNAVDDDKSNGVEAQHHDFKSTSETLIENNNLLNKESEWKDGASNDDPEINLQGFTETTQSQDETIGRDNRRRDSALSSVDNCETMNSENRQVERVSPVESNKQARGDDVHEKIAPALTFPVEHNSCLNANDDAAQFGFTENTQTQGETLEMVEGDTFNKMEKCVHTDDCANDNKLLDREEMDKDCNQDAENQQTCMNICDLTIGKDTDTKHCSDSNKYGNDDDLDVQMEKHLPRIERRGENMFSIFAGDTQSIPSQLVLTMDENKRDTSTKASEILASVEHHDTVEPDSEEPPESLEARNDVQNSNAVDGSQVLESAKSIDSATFTHDTNDSFYGGSTEMVSTVIPTTLVEKYVKEANHTEVERKESNPSEGEQVTLPQSHCVEVLPPNDTTNVDSVDGYSPTENKDANDSVSHPSKLFDDKETANIDIVAKEALFESIVNPTNTPIEDHFSYPKDYLTEEMMHRNNTSIKDTLSTTPQSQILLEPISTKKFQFSVINKVVGLGEALVSNYHDTVACSSDDETDNEVINDSTQLQSTTPNSTTMLPSGYSGSSKARNPIIENTVATEGDIENEISLKENSSHDFKHSNDATDSDTDGEDDYIPDARRRACNVSSLDDTQPEDEDNKPLINLRRVKRGCVVSRKEVVRSGHASNGSSDEEQEFTDNVFEQQSQNTRDIKFQLQKLNQYDIKNMARKLLQTPVATQKVLEEKIGSLADKCNSLETQNKELAREKASIAKELMALKCQLKEKNALIAEMKQRLDEYQPLLEAVQKLNMKSQSREVDETPTPKQSAKRRSKQSSAQNIEAAENVSLGDDYSTPNQKSLDRKNAVNVVSVSNQKRKRKSNVKGNMTFSNLWKILKDHGWSYKNAPMPLAGQVYVPPGGSVKIGAKAGVDFFEANDLLWEKAQELGIIDDNSQDEDSELNVISASSPITKSGEKDEQAREWDNSELIGKCGSLTEMSVHCCASLIKDFVKLGSEGRFMRNLFSPLWKCISDDQGSSDKNLAWRYCKSKGAGNLGRDYWFCPPNSKGSKGEFGVDYFTTEEAVVCHIFREVKKIGVTAVPYEEMNDMEIKLSRAIEQHIPFDEIKSSASSVLHKRPHRRTLPEPESGRKGAEKSTMTRSLTSDPNRRHKEALSKSKDKNQKTVTFSQNDVDADYSKTRIVNPLNILPDYDNMATASGIKKLLNLRRQSEVKRKVKDHEIEGSNKRLKLSPSAICHLTQNPDDELTTTEHFLNQPRWIKRSLNKDLPLNGLFFFGSGVDEKVRKTVELLGGTLIADISGNGLKEENVNRKLFFLSDVNRRRTHKYILACALGVPMLDFEWLFDLEKKFNEYKKRDDQKVPSAFDSHLFCKYRLPLGLSSTSGLFPLQKARHAKYWSRPGLENGSLLFEGMNIMIALEDFKSEKKWTDIIQSVGASVVSHNDIGKKGIKVDTIIVDSVTMPPLVTAVPLRVGKVLSKVASYQPNAIIVDLSWATQCIIQRKLLQTDEDRRYRVNMSKNKSPYREHVVNVYSIKVNQFNGLTRYEVGDTVNFARKNGDELSQGRITAIKYNTKTRTNAVEVKVLERHNACELMDGGKGICSVVIDEKALQGHIVILAGKDFSEVAWSKSSNVFLQKKA